jgi:multidrug efflux pump
MAWPPRPAFCRRFIPDCGTAQAYRDSLGSEPLLIVAALATVYVVLGILYESHIHPNDAIQLWVVLLLFPSLRPGPLYMGKAQGAQFGLRRPVGGSA